LLVLSAAGSKLSTYVLPLFPAIALLVAWHIADRLDRPSPLLRWATLAQAVLLGAVLAAVPFALGCLPPDWATVARDAAVPLSAAGGLLVLSMAAGGAAMARRRIVAGMSIVGAGAVATILVLISAASRLGVDRIATTVASELAHARRPGEPVVVSGRMVDDYSLVRAVGERVYVWGNARELGMGHFTEATPRSAAAPRRPVRGRRARTRLAAAEPLAPGQGADRGDVEAPDADLAGVPRERTHEAPRRAPRPDRPRRAGRRRRG
jgi:4-amino-4-deoxy-L-arabinose transferase-like glycosyltransferase